MFQVKQNESLSERRRIPVLLVDATDGYTPETSLSTFTVAVSQNGTILSSQSQSLTEVGNGIYYYTLGTGAVNTLGWVTVNVSATGCRNYNAIVQIMAYDAMDSTGLGLSRIDTNIGSRMATFTLPSNFDLLSINGSGAVTIGTINSTPAETIANTVLGASADTPYGGGNYGGSTFGARLPRVASSANNTMQITNDNHVSASVHEMQSNVITASSIQSNAIDANALATGAVSEIAQGVLTEATSTNPAIYAVGDVGNILGRLVNMVEADGADFRYTANALEQAPSGGGGGGSTTNIHMGPFVVKADGEESDIPLDIQKNAAHDIDIQLTDIHGTGVSLAGATTSVKVYNTGGTLVATYSGTATYSADGRLTFAITTAVTANAGTYTATVTRTTGASDTQVFGPLRIYVRDI